MLAFTTQVLISSSELELQFVLRTLHIPSFSIKPLLAFPFALLSLHYNPHSTLHTRSRSIRANLLQPFSRFNLFQAKLCACLSTSGPASRPSSLLLQYQLSPLGLTLPVAPPLSMARTSKLFPTRNATLSTSSSMTLSRSGLLVTASSSGKSSFYCYSLNKRASTDLGPAPSTARPMNLRTRMSRTSQSNPSTRSSAPTNVAPRPLRPAP